MARSIIGFHYGPGGDKQGIGDYMRRLNENGIPFMMKGADDAGLCFEGQTIGREKGVDNWLIYRLSTAGQGHSFDFDAPDYTQAPLEAAQKHWEKTVAKWPVELDKSIVWMEPINEPRAKASAEDVQWENLHPTDWLGKFMLEFARIANGQGYKVCGPSFNSGEPEVFSTNDYELPGMLAYMRYCADHPDQAALSIHEYVWDSYKHGETWVNWYPRLFGRVEAAFAAADRHGIPREFPIFVTEWGFAYRQAPRWPQCEPFLTAYNEWAARWPQIKGVAAWTLQEGWGGVDNDLVSWIGPLADYTIGRQFDPGPQPASTNSLVGQTKPSPVVVSNGSSGSSGAGSVASGGGDAAEAAGFAASVDLSTTDLAPNQTFTATWTFRNSGTTTWDQRTRLVYTDEAHPETAAVPRAHFAAETGFAITAIGAPAQVRPGEEVRLTVPLTAPGHAGRFGSNWRLEGADGLPFGPVRWVRASVAAAPVSQGTLDLQVVSFSNSVLNYEQLKPGQSFTGTWRLRNSGTAPWTGDFNLVYVPSGSHPEAADRTAAPLGGQTRFTLRDLSGLERVDPNEEVTIQFPFTAPGQAGRYAFYWQLQTPSGAPFGGLRWMKIGVVGEAAAPDPGMPGTGSAKPASTRVRFGMNININDGHPLDVDRLKGLAWVRYVFWASRRKKSPQQAYDDHYRHAIQSYASQGIRSLLILHQDTRWGNAPWDSGDWAQYAAMYAESCAEVARACAEFKEMVAYQIYNETDSGFGSDAGNKNPSAIGIPPEQYALILDAAVRAIRAVDPQATIVIGGMKTGPDNAIAYIRAVRQALGGRLPVDAIAYHPYGRYVDFDPFYEKQFGTLRDALGRFRAAFPGTKLWITEIGVADDSPIGSEHYEKIARYMREFVNEVADNHADLVEVLIWFAWSDLMRNSGITTIGGQMKDHIGLAFQEMVARGQVT